MLFSCIFVIQLSLGVHGWLVPELLADTKIHRCSSPWYRMTWNNAYSHPSTSTDSQLWIKNTVFDLRLVEYTDVKPGYTEGRLSICWKWSTFQFMVCNFSLWRYILFFTWISHFLPCETFVTAQLVWHCPLNIPCCSYLVIEIHGFLLFLNWTPLFSKHNAKYWSDSDK